ncbi:MAG: PQQ-like beta-propeller repeat protein [bacterium]|nr:PQQ-like beta-propeller repeat protein [bacterium]
MRSSDEDLGVPVKMFENPNLDRYLRRAESFLGDANYVAAIEVLQDVIQGRTVEFLGSSDEFAPPPTNADETSKDPAAKNAPKKKEPKAKQPKGPKGPSSVELDAANSVFSRDGRLYRPVRRLCHELLAEMPAAGIELYRTLHEVAARQMFEAAMASGSISELEKVINRYFITLPAGRAMVVLADRFMHEGRYRAAVQVLRDLIEIYPATNLKRIGADPIWCKFKIALCLRMAGESGVAQEAVREIAKEHPEDSLRILGELQSVRELPELPIFADEVIALLEGALADSGPSWLADGLGEAADPDGAGPEELVALWQYRFADPRPYRSPKSKRDRNRGFIRWGNGQRTTAMPHADRYGPASWIRFVPGESAGKPPRALFFDHYRLRVADARTGLMLQAGDGLDVPSKPRQGYPRIRIAAVDHALMRPVEDEVRRYAVLGHQKTPTQNVSTLRTSKLVAYDRVTMAPLWDSTQWLDGEDGLRDVTFLARPTIFGERLLLPAMRRDAYSLECLDRSTGRPLWHTMLHSGGSPFFKAPGSPVVVNGGIAFALTNAGCLAAVDAFAGDLRWIRRYEREDPLRPKMRPKGSTGRNNIGSRFVQSELSGFLPNDLIVQNGLVIFAGCDSGVVACVDSASGQPVWLVDGTTRYAPYGTLKTIVGTTASEVFLTSDTALVCIGLRGGLIKWMQELPAISGRKNVGRGRGTIAGDRVLIPGEGEIFVFDVKNEKAMQRLRLPSFGVGREPLQLPFNIQSAGSWLGIGYRGGVEVFSSRSALRGLAQEATDDPWRAAGLRISAGDLQEAEKILFEWLVDPKLDDQTKQKGCRRLLALVRERAMNLAEQKQLPQAMAAFDAIAGLCEERSVRLGWHLARVEVSKAAGDLRTHESEQQRLYDFMEGKG